MTTIERIATRGPGDDLIGKIAGSRSPRGAFIIYDAQTAPSHSNPSMWGDDENTQIAMTCEPTHYGAPRDQSKAARIRQTMGHFQFNRNLRLSAQKIAMCYTPTACMGGRAWTTIRGDDGVVKAICIFMNSIYGLIVASGYGQNTDRGRSTMGVTAVGKHPIPDFSADTDEGRQARSIAVQNFDRLRTLQLKRISLSVLDSNREEIDRVATLMLGIPWNDEIKDMLAYWRRHDVLAACCACQ